MVVVDKGAERRVLCTGVVSCDHFGTRARWESGPGRIVGGTKMTRQQSGQVFGMQYNLKNYTIKVERETTPDIRHHGSGP